MEKETREHITLGVSLLSFAISVSTAIITYVGRDTPYKTLVYTSQLDASSQLISSYIATLANAKTLLIAQERAAEYMVNAALYLDAVKSDSKEKARKVIFERIEVLHQSVQAVGIEYSKANRLYTDALVKFDIVSSGSPLFDVSNGLLMESNRVSQTITDFEEIYKTSSRAWAENDRKVIAASAQKTEEWSNRAKSIDQHIDQVFKVSRNLSMEMAAYFNASRFSIVDAMRVAVEVSPATIAKPPPGGRFGSTDDDSDLISRDDQGRRILKP